VIALRLNRRVATALVLAAVMLSSGAIGAAGFSSSTGAISSSPTPAAENATTADVALPVVPTTNSGWASPTITENPSVVQGGTSIVSMPLPDSGTPPYSWHWLFSTNVGVTFSPATAGECETPAGSGGGAGSSVQCVFATSTSTAPGYYFFELRVSDSASDPETVVSPASPAITVRAASDSEPRAGTSAPGALTSISSHPEGTAASRAASGSGALDPVATSLGGGTGGTAGIPTGHLREQPVLGSSASGTCTICTGTWFSPSVSASTNDFLILVITDDGEVGLAPSASDVSDSSGSTWYLNSSNAWNGTGDNQYVFTALDAANGADTVTFNSGILTTASDASAVLFALSNADTAVPIDVLGAFQSGASNSPSASVTSTVTDDMVVGLLSTWSGITVTATSGFTAISRADDGTATQTYAEEETVGSAGTYSSSPSITGSSPDWGIEAIAVAEAFTPGSASPASPTIDAGQSITLTANPAGGALPYAIQWYSGSGSGSCSAGTALGTSTSQSTGTLSAGTAAFCYTIGDGNSGSGASPWDVVTVNSALSVAAPSPASQSVDQGQSASLSDSAPTTGTAPYSFQWREEAPGAGSYSDASDCAAPTTLTCDFATTGSTPTGTYSFKLRVTDSSASPVAVDSSAATVVVNSALTAPAAPTITSNPRVDQGQTSTLTATLPNTGTSPYSWQWYYSTNGGSSYSAATSAECAVPSGSGASGGSIETCSFATTASTPTGDYLFEIEVTDSATTPTSATSPASSPVTVEAALATANAPSVVTGEIDQGQTPTAVTDTLPSTLGGSGTVTYSWFVSRNGGSYALATASECATVSGTATNGMVVNCVVGSGIATGTYTFEIRLTDQASSPETTSSVASGTVTVNFALASPGAPTVSTPTIDRGQTPVAASATLPSPLDGTSPVTYTWLVSFDGGGYAVATAAQCATPSGTASGGAVVDCVVGATVAVGSYTYEIELTDSATTPVTTVSGASGTVTVDPALASAAAPSVVTPAVDRGQTPTVASDTLPSSLGGSAPVTYTWLVSFNGGGYATATSTECATPSGTASGSLPVSCVAGASLATGSYTFEIELTDSASTPATTTSAASGTVTVASALAAPSAPTLSATALDVNQALTVTGTIPSTGTPTYSWQWLISVSGGSFADATQCSHNGGSGASAGATETCVIAAGSLAAGSNYAFEFSVTDSATTPESQTSSASATVTVQSALTAPAVPSVSATALDVNQALTVTGTVPSTGTSPYSWQWLFSVNGGAFNPTVHCATNSGSGASGGATETCAISGNTLTAGNSYRYELEVTDGASAPETATSSPSSGVSVSATLTSPSAPSITSNAVVDLGQTSTLTATVPSTGTAPYGWQWFYSTNGGTTYSAATSSECATPSGAGAAAGATETCSFATTGATPTGSYLFEFQVTDSATAPETVTSTASGAVSVHSALAPPAAPSITSNPVIDLGQTSTLTATLPSTGTAPYAWQWLYSTNGGSTYSSAGASQCSTPSGSGGAAGATETCSFVTTGATTTGSYLFEIQVTDSASTPVTITSSASTTVTVHSALTAPAAPSLTASAVDVNQAVTATATLSSSGTSPYSWQWEVSVNGGGYSAASQCATNSGSGASGGATETCAIAANTLTASTSYAFELKVTDSASTPVSVTSPASVTLTVASTLLAPAAPTISSNPVVDQGQTATLTVTLPTTGTSPYAWTWLYSTNGGSTYSVATSSECAVPSGSGASAGASETCSFATTGTTSTGSYLFEVRVTDSATSAETVTSSASAAVTVNSALTAPSAPMVSATALDADQAFSASSALPSSGTAPYGWQWTVSVNGGAFGAASQCATGSGSGASGGTTETCSVAANTLTAGDTYAFKLKATDSASTPSSATSAASSTVTVSTALAAPGVPTDSATSLDVDQALTITGTIPNSGTSPYAWQWLASVNSGGFSASSLCATNSGSGASAGATETCAIGAATLTVGDTYAFEFKVTDSATAPETKTSVASATVKVYSALTASSAPSVSATSLDVNQALTVTSTLGAAGTPPYSWQWDLSVNGGAYAAASQCATNSGSGASGGSVETCSVAAGTFVAGDSYAFELKVTDSATAPESATSAASSTVSVASALTAPSAPSPSATALDVNQALSVSGTVPSTGTAPYSWQWLVKINGAAAVAASACGGSASGSGASGGAVETCDIPASTLTVGDTYVFELQITDHATSPETTVSPGSATVSVSDALTAPGAPTPSGTSLDVNQALTVVGTIPSSGTPTYSWQWLVSVSGGTFIDASQCSHNSGSGASGGATETCSIAASALSAGSTYAFEFEVTDSASSPESQTSPSSVTVAVATALAAPAAPTITSNAVVDLGQTSVLSGDLPTTGTAPYSWTWLYSTNGGSSYSDATSSQCSSPTGSGGAGMLVPCDFVTTGSTPTGSYLFEIRVSDSATSPESATSAASAAVTVNSALAAPGAPTVSATSLDADQPLTVSGTLPSTGTSPYSWQWLISANGGTSFSDATQCSHNSGSGGSAGATETCSIAGNRLLADTTYAFKLQVTDSASTPVTATSPESPLVTTSSALTAGTPAPMMAAIDLGQSLTLTGDPSGGSYPYTIQWYVGASASTCFTPITGATTNTTVVTPLATGAYYYCYNVTDAHSDLASSADAEVVVNTALTAPATPAVSATALDDDQTLTVSGTIPSDGTAPYAWVWLVEVDGAGGYVNATACATRNGTGASAGATVDCVLAPHALGAGHSYTFELFVNDSSATPANVTSGASAAVAVSAALTAPAAPSVSATALDVNQALSVSASVPTTGTAPFAWQWLVSVNGGAFADATECAHNSGTGAAAGASETCAISSGSLAVSDRYAFELAVTDSASSPETATSATSSIVTVSTALSTPAVPTVSASKLDTDQTLIVTGALPSSGSLPLSWQWLFSVDGGAYAAASVCSAPTGSGGAYGATVNCTVPSGSLSAGSSYTFELSVSDAATSAMTLVSGPSTDVTASAPLAAGPIAPVAPTIDDGQSVTLSADVSGGAVGYTYQWYSGSSAGSCTSFANPIHGATSSSYSASPSSSTFYCYAVTDSATVPETSPSGATEVTVNSALTAPAAPSASASSISTSQGLTITGTIPTTGTPTYSWQWLISTNGGAYADATQCTVNGGNGAAPGATETCVIPAGRLAAGNTYDFELSATDSSSSPATVTSGPSGGVAVTAAPAAGFNWFWVYLLIAVVVLVAILAILLARRRRAAPAAPAPIAEWDEGPEGAPSSAPSSAPSTTPPVSPAPVPLPRPGRPSSTSSPSRPSPAPAPTPAGPIPPKGATAPPEPPAPSATANPPGAQEPLPEIDALMAELDRISGDISKAPAGPTKKSAGKSKAAATAPATDETTDSPP
jgi:hypothetical protein